MHSWSPRGPGILTCPQRPIVLKEVTTEKLHVVVTSLITDRHCAQVSLALFHEITRSLFRLDETEVQVGEGSYPPSHSYGAVGAGFEP